MSFGRIVFRGFMVTYILIALNVIVYAYTSFAGGSFVETDYYFLWNYGQVNWLVYNGWYWQLLTSMFVHVNITHLIGNMLFLLIFGLRAEEFFGAGKTALLYLLTGLAGNLVTLLSGPLVLSAGASGAIFGLFGAVTIYAKRAFGQSIMSALMYAFVMLILSMGLQVNLLAHLGGLVTGLFAGYLLAVRHKQRISHQYSYSYQQSL